MKKQYKFIISMFLLSYIGVFVLSSCETKPEIKQELLPSQSGRETYNSQFGFIIKLPSHWLILSKQEIKENPDLFDSMFELKTFKDMSKPLQENIKNSIRSGSVEIFFNQNTSDIYFRDNINITKSIGSLPKTALEMNERCENVSIAMNKNFGKTIKVYKCELRKVAALNSVYMETGGIINGTRMMQYQIQKSPSVIITVTASFKNQILETFRKEFENIMASFKLK